jgi:hypothetical protein
MFPEFEHPALGKIRQLGMPVKLSDTPAKFRNFSPLIGQHTDEILKELGYTNKQIEELRKALHDWVHLGQCFRRQSRAACAARGALENVRSALAISRPRGR